MTSPPTQNSVMLAPKTYEMFKQYHTIMANLMQAHEKWEQAESLITEHSGTVMFDKEFAASVLSYFIWC